MQIITKLEAERIFKLAQREQRLTSTHITDLADTQTKFIYNKIFRADAEKLANLNISMGIQYLIASIFADYIGKPDQVEYPIDQFVMSYIWGGYSVMVCRMRDGQFIVDYASPDSYIQDDDGTEHILTFLEQDENGLKQKYILKETYTIGRIERKLYKQTQRDKGGLDGQEVPLETLDYTQGLPDSEITGLPYNPIITIHNKKLSGYGKYGDSEFAIVESMIRQIEIQETNIGDQFMKHLDARLAVPSSKLPINKDGKVDLRTMEVIPMEAGDPNPQYVANTNPLMQHAFTYIDNLTRQLASALSIPVEFMGIKAEGGAEAEGTKQLRISVFIKKVESIRRKYEQAHDRIIEIQKAWGQKPYDSPLMWQDTFPQSSDKLVSELGMAIDAGIISRRRATMMYLDMDEAEAEAEISQANAENSTVDDTLEN